MENNWTPTGFGLPEVGIYVVVSVKDGTYIYIDVMKLEEDGSWSYHDDKRISENLKVIAWMDCPPTFVG